MTKPVAFLVTVLISALVGFAGAFVVVAAQTPQEVQGQLIIYGP